MALPVEINPLHLQTSGAYPINKSLRFRSSASAYLSRTFATPTSSTIYTWSGWVKRGALGATNYLFGASTTTNFGFNSSNNIVLTLAGTTAVTTTAVYRDPSAWYHVVYQQNGAAQTISINGVSAGTGTTANTVFNTAIAHQLSAANTTSYFDGYLAEVNFIDGQALAASSFGAYDTNGVWQPKKYSGTYGTNGFYLPFGTTTSTATLGNDSSGNGNTWTVNNVSLTAGTTYDSMTDSPTVTSASVANYATLNPIGVPYNTGTAAGGNLNWTGASTADKGMAATISMSSGKWYWECTVTATAAGSNSYVGIAKTAGTADSNANRVYYRGDGAITKYGTTTTGLTTYTTNDVIGIAYDYSAQTLAFYKNNVLVTTVTSINLEANLPWVGGYTTTESWAFNAGQRPLTYSAPTGFNALNTYNLPTPTIANGAQYFAASTYTGNLTGQTITNGGNNTIGTTFQPDLVWVKSRSAATDHKLTDAVRGATKALISDTTGAETTDVTGLTAFASNGFTLGVSTVYNNTGATYVAWQWLANGAGSSNTNGSITSTVSANTTAGFSVVTYTSTGANATVGHGLGVAPSMIIIKNRQAANSWVVYHVSTGNGNVLLLNSTNASTADSTAWNTTTPTSSVFSLGSGAAADTNQTTGGGQHIAYCWAAISGYSAFGSYAGTGVNPGPFVYLGFRPRWIMFKNSSAAFDWVILDTSRDTYNQFVPNSLVANTSGAESSVQTWQIDALSNGMTIRNTSSTLNGSANTIIYAAFAENPFNSSRAR